VVNFILELKGRVFKIALFCYPLKLYGFVVMASTQCQVVNQNSKINSWIQK
jgi:hypothetical protein